MGLKTTWTALILGAAVTAASAWQQANDALATARALIQQGRNEEAITELNRLAALDPQAKGVSHELGVAYYHQSEYLKAAQYLVRALQENPNDRDAAVAENEVCTALELASRLPLAHFMLGELCVYKADYPCAVGEYEAELAINPGYAPTLSHLGEVYWRLNRYDESEEAAQRAIWLDSTSSEPYVILGKVFFKKRQWMTAEHMLQRAITGDPSNYTAHYF